MPGNQARILLREDDLNTEWFRFRNINKWIHKFWKPVIIGMYVGKYEGEWKNGKEHGQGTYYSSSGGKLVGRFKGGIPWNTTDFDEDQNFIGLHVRGVEREIIPLKLK